MAKSKTGFNKEMEPSRELSKIVGKDPISRGQVMKKIWLYIKKNKLQDPKKKRDILADDALKAVFGGKGRVNMFEMPGLIFGKHLS